MVSRKAYDEVLRRVAASIATMGSSRGLDLGLKVRALDETDMKRTGNRLVSAYCRNRLTRVGDMKDIDKRDEAQRAVHEVLSLQPQDPWVLLRAASLLAFTGDTTRARTVAAPAAMPERWLLRTIPASSVSKPISAPSASARLRADSAWFASAEPSTPPGGWQALQSENSQATYGSLLTFSEGRMRASDKTSWLLHTKVFAERAESCYVNVSMPARFRVWVNGAPVEKWDRDQARTFYALRASLELPQRFDMCSYPVVLRPGANTIEIAFVKEWFEVKPTPWFRVGFAGTDGTAVGCEGNRLRFPESPAL
jgi:hypothetical protein